MQPQHSQHRRSSDSSSTVRSNRSSHPNSSMVNLTTGPHAAFILLAEFDIDTGSGLRHYYPRPIGTSEHILADLMLPDGAHDRTEDWTVFFLNQTPRLTVQETVSSPNEENSGLPSSHRLKHPSLSHENDDVDKQLLYVISLVRTKKDTSVRRGAICKAMAVCSPHPYIQIFKPILLLALEDYFTNPSIECLAQLYHALNTMETSGMPNLTHHERIVLRCSERSDIFEEKFDPSEMTADAFRAYLHNLNSRSLTASPLPTSASLGRRGSGTVTYAPSIPSSSSFISFDQQSIISLDHSLSDSNDSLSQDSRPNKTHARTSSNLVIKCDEPKIPTSPVPSSTFAGSSNGGVTGRRPKDTHFYDTKINYGGKSIPVRIPLQTFPEEVGEYSLIQLIQTFSTPNAMNSNGLIHPHLHTNGHSTHPIIVLFNALITQKRVMFLGHGLPAAVVSQMVLAACALGSGCGGVLEGFTERTFPYSNLTIYEDFRSVPGYIAGVTNPIFELHTESWDVFCNLETGKITVSKDIVIPQYVSRSVSPLPPERSLTELGMGMGGGGGSLGSGSLKGGVGIAEDVSKGGSTVTANSKMDGSKESADQAFIDDILSAIVSHFGEHTIRSRFTDYVRRFVRLASRWEEENLGSSSIGTNTKPFEASSSFLNTTVSEEKMEMLGSGPVFGDEVNLKRELSANTSRIEAWRETSSYRLYRARHARGLQTSFKFDAEHQLSRLRVSKKISEVEVQAMYEVLVAHVQTHQEVIEILSHAPPYSGGLSPFVFGLHHPSEKIRNLTVEFIRRIESNPTGNKFFQGLNSFHKLAYQRLAHYLYKPGFAHSWGFAEGSGGGHDSFLGGFGGHVTAGEMGGAGGSGLNGFVVYED